MAQGPWRSPIGTFEPGPADPLQLHSKTGPTADDAFDPGHGKALNAAEIARVTAAAASRVGLWEA